MKNLIILFLVSLTLLSCKKERAFHITATNVATGERIPNLHYYVVEASAGSFEEKTKTIREGYLDANGEAKFNMKIKNKKHVIRVVEPENNCYSENISLTFGSKEDFKADFKFAPCGYIKIKINNVNCEGPSDDFKLYNTFNQVDFIQSLATTPVRFGTGCYVYAATDFSSIPMGKRMYKWEVTRSGVMNVFYDTIMINEGEYRVYEINY